MLNRECQPSYTVLNEDDRRQRQEEVITRISTVLSIPRVSASILLRHYNWDVSKVYDAWFADEERVRKATGLLENSVVPNQNMKELNCGICFEAYPRDRMYAAACGHHFCRACPDPSCGAAVGQDLINLLTKWCPAPGCDFAVDFVAGSSSFDVSCNCSFSFCTEEAHRPVDCVTVAKWILKNCAEFKSMNWISANSKPCPKCKRPIQKIGCMHITCTPPCKFEFCWLCLGAWSDHGKRTCNRYEAAKQEAKKRREMAKNSLERYTHYYERWATNRSSRLKAVADLQQMQSVHIKKLSDKQCRSETQFKFITEAWLQIIECRRVLKWTYAYGYYLPENEHAKRQFFEYLQGEAESGLERLHQCAEKELQTYLNAEGPSEGFNDFKTKLAGLTSVTRNYFENLVRALENGLSDVDSQGACSKTTSSDPRDRNNNLH
ncbi:hypothetical protein MKW92_041988 [Papaver armeniacum]|nr:hypothetical protein MKW92_041988 [Papaver armeniacum]